MKGYIYTMYKGADPGKGWKLSDPILGKVPTLGACMPNIRRLVTKGDYIFAISGRATGVKQYVVGGFQVAEKINALAAYKRFPHNRQRKLPDGSIIGNIIVNESGSQNTFDYHSNFERRLENYIVGKNPIAFERPEEIEAAREQTVPVLSTVFEKHGDSVSEVVGRWRKLEEAQVGRILEWMEGIKGGK